VFISLNYTVQLSLPMSDTNNCASNTVHERELSQNRMVVCRYIIILYDTNSNYLKGRKMSERKDCRASYCIITVWVVREGMTIITLLSSMPAAPPHRPVNGPYRARV
jgi:hypothetical protein